MEPIFEHPMPEYKPRNAFVAFLLSLFFPGLGQIYNGQLGKGIIFFALSTSSFVVFGLSRWVTSFSGLVSFAITVAVLEIWFATDAIIFAKRQQRYIPKPINKWYYHLLIAIFMIVLPPITNLRGTLGIQAYKTPSGANEPTLMMGDWMMADTKMYKKTDPKCGDIIVFNRDGGIYLYRVVGVPGDNIEVVNDIVSVNGKASKTVYIQAGTSNDYSTSEYEEILPNGHKHGIYLSKVAFEGMKNNVSSGIIPPNKYYVLGDNRDNAMDSRYKGFVDKADIKGKVVYTYWGAETDRINVDLRNK